MVLTKPLNHLKINSSNIEEIIDYIRKRIAQNEHFYCIPLNLTKYAMAKTDKKLRAVINSADLVVADGISIVWLSKQ